MPTLRPTDTGSLAERIYAQLEPYSVPDQFEGWPLLCYIAAGGVMSQDIDDIVSDDLSISPPGIGWSKILDLNRCPTAALGWLAQFVGVQLRPGTDAQQRAQIASTDGWQRGKPSAIVGAVQPLLTGNKTVIMRERDSAACAPEPAYGLTVITYTSETPSQSAVLAALNDNRIPGGIILNYQCLTGEDFQSLFLNNATFQTLYTTYTSFQGVVTAQPGT